MGEERSTTLVVCSRMCALCAMKRVTEAESLQLMIYIYSLYLLAAMAVEYSSWWRRGVMEVGEILGQQVLVLVFIVETR